MGKTGKRSPSATPGSGMRMKRPFVLVVDDIADNREMYMEYLRFAGFQVAGAHDGDSAIAAARELGPSVILMDLSLPGTDGWKATRILKADPATRNIPIIALSGHAGDASHARAIRAGCDLFVAKPSLPSEIAAHVIRMLDDTRKRESGGS
jgi:two-component system, cell cycle response regulator DivK